MFKRFNSPGQKPEIPDDAFDDASEDYESDADEARETSQNYQPPQHSYADDDEPLTHSQMNSTSNFLSNDVEIEGSLKFSDELYFDGKIDGEIASDGLLTIGENAEVKGEVKTRAVVIYGRVEGNVAVEERCELKANSELNGDLKAARLMIEEGAAFVGKSEVATMGMTKPSGGPSTPGGGSSPSSSSPSSSGSSSSSSSSSSSGSSSSSSSSPSSSGGSTYSKSGGSKSEDSTDS